MPAFEGGLRGPRQQHFIVGPRCRVLRKLLLRPEAVEIRGADAIQKALTCLREGQRRVSSKNSGGGV
jgi:hypothetical protein